MQKPGCILLFCFLAIPGTCFSQDSLSFKGQLSAWSLLNFDNDLPVYSGARYIPQLNYKLPLQKEKNLDFETSFNINGSIGFKPFDSLKADGQVKPYRLWARFSTRQFELRAGLQKINFGSASLLRPLMWFDQIDPRDPLKLTDGVWGILGRYYFLNNANIWIWGLYGNDKPRGWEVAGTNSHFPEAGGRIQLPVPSGEVALTYHFRMADTRDLVNIMPAFDAIPENRLGFDIKLDLKVGLWMEGAWIKANKDLDIYTNQEMFNAGIDYTFGLGNGLYVIYEQLLASLDRQAFDFQNTTSFSLLSLSYPVGLFDNVSAIVYYDWKRTNIYSFLTWQRQFNALTLYLMGFWNPENYYLPAQSSNQNLFTGKGIQFMVVWNH